MKKYLMILLMMFTMFLVGCNIDQNVENEPQPEQPHMYWKDIDVVVTEIDKRTWFATTRRWIVNLEVYNEEYGLTEFFDVSGSGFYGCPKEWNYEVGDVVTAELHSWVMDSTGEVVKRNISHLK